MVVQQSPKLFIGVRIPALLPIPKQLYVKILLTLQTTRGSNPQASVDKEDQIYYPNIIFRGVAQLIERVVWDHEAAGLSPVTPTTRLGFCRHSTRVLK